MREEAMSSTVAAGAPLAERVRNATRALVQEAGAAFARTPLEVLLGIGAAVGLSVAIEQKGMENWAHLLVAVAIALPLTYAASALALRSAISATLRWAISVAVIAAAALYAYLVFDPNREAEAWRAFLLVGAAFGLLLCVPLIRPVPGDRREQEQRFIARFAGRVIIVAAYAGALWLGLALALAAINGLFELHMSGKAWAHLASALFVLLPPWAVAAGLPALLAPIDDWSASELRLLRRLGLFLLAPLVLVYLAIVYAYTVRVLATGEVPKNLVSPVVIGAGILIVVTTFALEPVHDDEQAGGLSFLLRLVSPLLLPLVLFAMWAVSSRVGQYGWTEFRFLRLLALVLLAAYAAAALYRLVRRRRPPLTFAPAVLASVLLLAAVGPWSATAVAHRSQAGALRHYLTLAGRAGPAATRTTVPTRVFRGITEKASYLQQHFGWGAVRDVVPWIGARPSGTVGMDELALRIGVAEVVSAGMMRVLNAHLPDERGISGIVGGTLFVFNAYAPSEKPRPRRGQPPVPNPARQPGQAVVVVERTPGRLDVIAPAGDTLFADIAPLMSTLLQRSASETGRPVYNDRRDDEDAQRPESARELEVMLEPADAVQPIVARDGHTAGQLILRQMTFEARGAAPNAAAKGAGPAPASPTLRIRSVSGFLVLAAPAPAR